MALTRGLLRNILVVVVVLRVRIENLKGVLSQSKRSQKERR